MTADDGWTYEPQLLQPRPESIKVVYHPHRELGDIVSLSFTDPKEGEYVVALHPVVVAHLARMFGQVESVPLQVLVDQVHAHQRERDR